jgi:hypothetical protein
LAVVGSACAGLALQVWLLHGAWIGLPVLAAAAFLAAAAAVSVDRRAVGFVLLFAYVFPALIRIAHGPPTNVYFGTLWMAALVGAIVPDSLRTSWHVPPRWRAALVLWALVLAVGAPIVALREMDFYPGIAPFSGGSTFPARWVLHVALVQVVGILWFDWLFGARDLNFQSAVATPLAVSTLMMTTIAGYQLFGDFSFLNQNVFGATGRASGSVLDANVCGAVAALWTGGFILWGTSLRRGRTLLTALGFIAAWLAVWASGSRSALMSAAIVTAFALVGLASALRHGGVRLTPLRVGSAGILFMVFVLSIAFANTEVVGPAARVWRTLPSASTESWRDFAVSMWSRSGYGTAAVRMIREFPLAGVGVSAYHTLVSSMAPRRPPPDKDLPPDNAQNWFRHQLAELGVLGSIGWAAWVVLFAAFVLKPPRGGSTALWTARGVLVAFAAVSMVGVPGQDVIVIVTFWTFAFWYVSLAGPPAGSRAISMRTWAAVALVVAAFAVATVNSAATRLRPPVRAQWLGGPFEYGFYQPEAAADGRQFRWAAQRAAIVLDAPSKWLEVTVGVNHQDVAERPVDASVWIDRKAIIDTRLTSTQPTVQVVRIPDEESRVLLETMTSRVLVPREFGVNDARELGLMVSWRFLDGPPQRVSAIRSR